MKTQKQLIIEFYGEHLEKQLEASKKCALNNNDLVKIESEAYLPKEYLNPKLSNLNKLGEFLDVKICKTFRKPFRRIWTH